MKIDNEKLSHSFNKIYGKQSDITIYFSPETINISGFYDKNPVSKSLSFKINAGTYLVLSKRKDKDFRIANSIDAQKYVFYAEDSRPIPEDLWINYSKSIIWKLMQNGFKLPFGLNLYFDTDFLNSDFNRSSLLMLMAKALNEIYEFKITEQKLLEFVLEIATEYFKKFVSIQEITACSIDAEHKFIYFDNPSKISLLNTHTSNYSFIVTYIQNKISNSIFYRQKVEEGFKTLALMAKKLNLPNLKSLNLVLFEKQKHLIEDKILQKRAWFILYELQRCSLAADFLKKSDFKALGQLLNQSESSLQRDFDHQNTENNIYIDIAWRQTRLYGLRSITYSLNNNIILSIIPKAIEKDFIKSINAELSLSKNNKIHIFSSGIESSIDKF